MESRHCIVTRFQCFLISKCCVAHTSTLILLSIIHADNFPLLISLYIEIVLVLSTILLLCINIMHKSQWHSPISFRVNKPQRITLQLYMLNLQSVTIVTKEAAISTSVIIIIQPE